MIVFRATTQTTTQCATAIRAYAAHPQLKHLRLAFTERYVHPSDFPAGFTNGSLIQNCPLLIAVADLDIDLPFADAEQVRCPVAMVIDSPGMTMRRSPRDQEVAQLLDDVLALKLPHGRVAYAVQSVSVTEHLTPAAARQTILAADYMDFQTSPDASDLKRRLGA
ncbi:MULTISPECIES: hypothetical protein [Burkholderiaceae]|uniref:Uncharacterized protein n=1 Tax=Paraburkholderia aromaticivorans TaxID=2026199 RepID=A0A248VXH8_9BURK|nr:MULTISPECIES: hypothetical protein [Burkholderiaceae]ASW03746.1 hypothetical protein CJU94_36765 [Paraburkholderia aromaticivorans]KVR81434.1 hypothetical protein WK24_02180 [Burkholderia vietnamiensis]MBR8054576.1 hypothetical protein [Burkholderia vietnamiensis]MCA7889864.1 hypothetical protein [Burkholderia contaminans]MCA7988797.1 hypothetical protein [Burkholderia vietnamiensis]